MLLSEDKRTLLFFSFLHVHASISSKTLGELGTCGRTYVSKTKAESERQRGREREGAPVEYMNDQMRKIVTDNMVYLPRGASGMKDVTGREKRKKTGQCVVGTKYTLCASTCSRNS